MDKQLKIFGIHDEGTLSQINRCLEHESAVKGTICADGHLGYSMPIGGVVAYKDAVSPSGVGYDIGCLTGDTRIFTLDGKNPTLAEANGTDVFVLASTPEGRIVPAKATVSQTRRDAPLVRVTLDNGRQIRCTPDHRFMARDGRFIRADQMEPGSSLMPLYTCPDKDGYVLVRNNATGRLVRLHWLVFHHGLTEPAPPRVGGEVLVIHHKDFYPTNNDPSNLRPMGKGDHDALHTALRDKGHLNTAGFDRRRREGIRDFWASARQDPDFMAKRAATATRNIVGYMEDRPEHFREAVRTNGQRGAEYLRQFNLDPETQRKYRERYGQPSTCPICLVSLGRSPNSVASHAKKAHPDLLRNKPKRLSTVKHLTLANPNHKVVSVEHLTEREDVYCLNVPEYHNFALADGVFVHNCGNLWVRTEIDVADIWADRDRIMRDVATQIAFGVGRNNPIPIDDELFDDPTWDDVPVLRQFKELARTQLGTVGSGNHYVDLFRDEGGKLSVGVHFGSRGFGHHTARGFLALAAGKSFDEKAADDMHAAPTVLPLDSPLGQDYWAAMTLAGAYARAGREAVVRQVLRILGTIPTWVVHNHHNFAWRETHGGEEYVVIRKGSTPNFPGTQSFVGGTMASLSYVIEGVDAEESRASLYSTIHGAGRAMGRRMAIGKKGKPGLVTPEMLHRAVTDADVILVGGGLDESPHCYKDIDAVLAAHRATVKIVHTLTPIGVAMAGKDVRDPYKD